MSDSITGSLIGRVAQLCNLVSKPQLNGVFVLIKSYESKSMRYSVTTLECPTNPSLVAVYKVKSENLTFEECFSFSDRFPNAKIYEGDLQNVQCDLSGNILNIVDGTSFEASFGRLLIVFFLAAFAV